MATWTYEVATEYNFPNITVYKKCRDGVHLAWRINSNDGYVMYDTTEENYEIDPETGLETPVIYYYTMAQLPMNYPFNNFPWVAVPRDSVDENYIFGLPTEEPEVM